MRDGTAEHFPGHLLSSILHCCMMCVQSSNDEDDRASFVLFLPIPPITPESEPVCARARAVRAVWPSRVPIVVANLRIIWQRHAASYVGNPCEKVHRLSSFYGLTGKQHT